MQPASECISHMLENLNSNVIRASFPPEKLEELLTMLTDIYANQTAFERSESQAAPSQIDPDKFEALKKFASKFFSEAIVSTNRNMPPDVIVEIFSVLIEMGIYGQEAVNLIETNILKPAHEAKHRLPPGEIILFANEPPSAKINNRCNEIDAGLREIKTTEIAEDKKIRANAFIKDIGQYYQRILELNKKLQSIEGARSSHRGVVEEMEYLVMAIRGTVTSLLEMFEEDTSHPIIDGLNAIKKGADRIREILEILNDVDNVGDFARAFNDRLISAAKPAIQ